MKRKDVINHIRVAGYHNDAKRFTRLYVEGNISRPLALDAWDEGAKQRQNGIKCNCVLCNWKG